MIYFIRAGENGPVKIGRSRDPRRRLADLQVSHHETLCLLAVMDGDEAEEWTLHRAFPPVRGEWCEPTPELLDYIERNAILVTPMTSRFTSRIARVSRESDRYQKVRTLVAEGKSANDIDRILPGSRTEKLRLVRKARADLDGGL